MNVRTSAPRASIGAVVLLAVAALAARAEGPVDLVDFEATLGGRFLSGGFGEAKFREYRDIRPGAFGSGSFLAELDEGREFVRGSVLRVSDSDQAYGLEVGRWNWLRIGADYRETPHTFNTDAMSPYRLSGARLRLPSTFDRVSLQAATGAAQSALLESELAADARPVDLGFAYRTGGADLRLTPIPALEIDAGFHVVDRDGTRPLSAVFGSPGGHFVNFPGRVDERTRRVHGDLRFVQDAWNVELGYVGSFFENDVRGLTLDNPLSAVDANGASATGRISRARSTSRSGSPSISPEASRTGSAVRTTTSSRTR